MMLLIDAPEFMHRAHAIRAHEAGPMFFAEMIRKLVNRECGPNDHAMMIWDVPPLRRAQFYPAYKATRSRENRPNPRAYRNAHGLPAESLYIPGLEADDTIARMVRNRHMPILVAGSDKDLLQLVDDSAERSVLVWSPAQERYLDEMAVRSEWDVRPDQLADVLALMGDASDNIPGVPGIGKEWAKDLVRRFGSLEGVYENLPSVAPGKRAMLERHRDSAFLSRALVRFWDETTTLDLPQPNQTP